MLRSSGSSPGIRGVGPESQSCRLHGVYLCSKVKAKLLTIEFYTVVILLTFILILLLLVFHHSLTLSFQI